MSEVPEDAEVDGGVPAPQQARRDDASADRHQQPPRSPHPVVDDPLFPDAGAAWQPRIIPSPPPQRGRLLLGVAIGLATGLLVFGTAGFLVGSARGGPSADTVAASPEPTASPTLPAYEAGQLRMNEATFTGQLRTFARSWLPVAASCAETTPERDEGEAARIGCEWGGVNIFFVRYERLEDRDRAREARIKMNVDARRLAPGAADVADKPVTSGNTTGSYVEYAYDPGTAPVVCGLWWDDADAPVAGYIVGFWAADFGARWEPLRDIWQRFS